MLAGRSEQYKAGKATSVSAAMAAQKRLSGAADSAYEDALIRLQEILSDEATVAMWFDRSIDAVDSVSLEALPRVITSKSTENLATEGMAALGWKKKADVKLEALREALAEMDLADETAEQRQERKAANVANAATLKAKLAKLKKGGD